MHVHPPQAGPRPAFAAALGVLLVAAIVRATRVMHGLPDFLEEALPLRQALQLFDPATGAFDPNPHFFNYPSLSIYVHFLVQLVVFAVGWMLGSWHNAADYLLSYRLDPTVMVAVARGVGIAVDLLAIVAVMRIGERLMRGAGWVAGLIAAVSPLLIVTSSSIFCDGMMACAGLWALERVLAWCDGDEPRPMAAAVLIGIAAGAKYPGALLLLPLGVAMVIRDGRGALTRWAACAGVALAVFLVTTPFAVLAWPEFVRDLSFEGGHAAEGHLGSAARPAVLFFLRLLVGDLGWAIALAAVAAAFVPALARRAPRDMVVVLVAAAVAFAPIALGRIEADRYLVLTTFLVATLAAASIVTAMARAPQGVRMSVSLAAIAWPLWATSQLSFESPTTTQMQARRWCEANVAPDAVLIQEAYGVHLFSHGMREAAIRTPEFAAASSKIQDRVRSVRAFRVATLPLVVSGRWNGRVSLPDGSRRELRAFDHGVEVNRIFYDPALFAGADYVVTSSAVRDRLIADSLRVPEALAVYRWLERHTTVAARFDPRGRVRGPSLVVHKVEAPARALLAPSGALDPMWWTRPVAADYADRVAALLGPQAMRPASDDGPPLWVTTLKPIFDSKVGGFASELALELAALERYPGSLPLALSIHTMHPEDLGACALASVAARRTGDPGLALRVLERTRRSVGEMPSELELETARAQVASGHREDGARLLGRLIARLDSTGAVAMQAMRELAELNEASTRAQAESAAAAQAAAAQRAAAAAAAKGKVAAKGKAPTKKPAPASGVATIKPGR